MTQPQIKTKFFMGFRVWAGAIGFMILMTAGCSFHLRGSTEIPKEFKTLVLESSDFYGPLTRSIRQELRQNRVTIVDSHQRTDLPTLRILGSSQRKSTVSIFQDGVTAENQLSLTLSAQILVPGHDIYPIQVKVFRAFLDNPLMTLPKEAESEILNQEMMKQAAQKLIRQLSAVHEAIFKDSEKIRPNSHTKKAIVP